MNYKLGFALGLGARLLDQLVIFIFGADTLDPSVNAPSDLGYSYWAQLLLYVLIATYISQCLSLKMGRIATTKERRNLAHCLVITGIPVIAIHYIFLGLGDVLQGEILKVSELDNSIVMASLAVAFVGTLAIEWVLFRIGVSIGQKVASKKLNRKY